MIKNSKYYHGFVENTNIIYLSSREIDLDQSLENRHMDFDKYSIGNIQYVLDTDRRVCIVTSISVKPDYQHRGIATNLFKEMTRAVSREHTTDCADPNRWTIELDSMTNVSDEKNLFCKLGLKFVDKNSGPEMIGYLDDLNLD